ncbi:MAG: signal peptidase II [Chromatiales bacterium]|jgi:signal peptidase II|nr:signal peptidase II [Chromatiales bacterium]MDP7269895.1 signal peptidase II [Gammaproteobacteria bacterium]HJP04941.1 signal peptidase II [Gammaproteobacteria bacterium]
MNAPENRPDLVVTPIAGSGSLRWLILSLVLVIADQVTKLLVVSNLDEFERIKLLPVFDLVRFHNTGAAFSFLANAGGWQHWLFTGIAIVVSVGIVWYQWGLPQQGCRTLAAGLALVLGGAVGNLIDRLLQGYVVDFLLVYYGDWHWPAFNVADSSITVGVTLIIIDSMFLERKRVAAAASE